MAVTLQYLGFSVFLLFILAVGIVIGSNFYFSVPFCNEKPVSLLVVPLKPIAADMVVVVTTGSLIEEFLVNGKEASRLSIKSQKCTWNTTGSYSGTTVETSFSVILYVEIQKSSFIVPPLQNLGKSYTLMTFWGEAVHSYESWFVISAPMDSTTVYLDSARVKRFSSSFHKTWFHQGDLFQFDLNEGDSVFVRCRFDLSGIIINGSKALFVAMGAMDKDGEFVTVQLSSDKWGHRFLIDDLGPINIWGDNNTTLSVISSANEVHMDVYQSFPVLLSLPDNQTYPCLLHFSKPVLVFQKLLIVQLSQSTFRTKTVIPIHMYLHKTVFSIENMNICFPEHPRFSFNDTIFKAVNIANQTIDIEEEQFSSATIAYNNSDNQTTMKELRRKNSSMTTFSGYLYCKFSFPRFYQHPAAWHVYLCNTSKDAGCVRTALRESGPTLIRMLHDPYIASSIASVTFSLVSGLGAVIVFVALAYLADQIRTRITGSSRIGIVIE